MHFKAVFPAKTRVSLDYKSIDSKLIAMLFLFIVLLFLENIRRCVLNSTTHDCHITS